MRSTRGALITSLAAVNMVFFNVVPVTSRRTGVHKHEVVGEDIWDIWRPSSCDMCLDTPIKELRDPTYPGFSVGCIGLHDHSAVPLCNIDTAEGNPQAGGHVGTFYVLDDDKVAKFSPAFSPLADGADSKTSRQQQAAGVEWNFYMQLWCLRQLRAKKLYNTPHLLDPFASGPDPWAPNFFGLCRIVDVSTAADHKLFIVMENLFRGYEKPSQLDLKVGATIEPNSLSGQGLRKYMRKTVADTFTPTAAYKARLAGYKVWDKETDAYNVMWEKSISPLMSLNSVFSRFLTEVHRNTDGAMLEVFGKRLAEMYLWWREHGSDEVRSIAGSLLWIYEGDASSAAARKITIKRAFSLPSNSTMPTSAYVKLVTKPKQRLQPCSGDVNSKTPTCTSCGDSPKWEDGNGYSTCFQFPPDIQSMTLEVWDSRPSEVDRFLGSVVLDPSAPTKGDSTCSELESCADCASDSVPPRVCYTIRSTGQKKPSLKLIDFAHFFPRNYHSDWPDDGVAQGLASSLKQIDVMNTMLAAPEDRVDLKFEELCGASVACTKKCPTPSAEHEGNVHPPQAMSDTELLTCQRFAFRLKYRYLSWKDGLCRLCDSLVSREFGISSMVHSIWQVFEARS